MVDIFKGDTAPRIEASTSSLMASIITVKSVVAAELCAGLATTASRCKQCTLGNPKI